MAPVVATGGVLFVGDSIERLMLRAAANEGLVPPCDNEHPAAPQLALSTMRCGNVYFVHNRLDISKTGPWHYVGVMYKNRPVQHADLPLTLKSIPGPITHVQLACNFWVLARLRSYDKPKLYSMDTSPAVGIMFKSGINDLMATIECYFPNATYGWSERYRAAPTQNRDDYFFGNRIMQLNTQGTLVALRRGWSVFKTHNNTVPLRDQMHPTDQPLVAQFREMMRGVLRSI
jgi:hypothetical protein